MLKDPQDEEGDDKDNIREAGWAAAPQPAPAADEPRIPPLLLLLRAPAACWAAPASAEADSAGLNPSLGRAADGSGGGGRRGGRGARGACPCGNKEPLPVPAGLLCRLPVSTRLFCARAAAAGAQAVAEAVQEAVQEAVHDAVQQAIEENVQARTPLLGPLLFAAALLPAMQPPFCAPAYNSCTACSLMCGPTSSRSWQ